jgi:hypothetical protein
MAGSLHVKMLDAGAPEVLASKNSVTRLDVFVPRSLQTYHMRVMPLLSKVKGKQGGDLIGINHFESMLPCLHTRPRCMYLTHLVPAL